MNEYWADQGLYVWDPQTGNKVYSTDWIFRVSLLSMPFLGGEILSKGLLILSITLSGFGAFCLGKRLQLNSYVSFAAGILYVFSPIIFTRIVAGYIYYLIAYFLSPLILANFLKGKEENSKRYFIIAGLLLSFAAIQLQFLAMIFFILLIFALVDFKLIKKSIIGLFIVFSITFLITFSPIILSQLVVNKTEVPFNPTQLLSYFTVETSSDLLESLRILGYKGMPYSYLNLGTSDDKFESNAGIMPSWIFYLDYIIPIVGFSVLLFRRDKYTVSFAVISILGIYLLKGLNPPFPGVFEFLFVHGFYIFREIWHLAFLYGLSITFLVAFFIEMVLQLKLRPLIKVSLSAALISVIVISNGYPLLLGNFAGYLQTYNFPNEYHTLYNNISSDPHYNVLILPYIRPMLYDNLRLEGTDPFISYTPTMIFAPDIDNKASPTQGASTWLLSSMQENKTQNLGKVLSGFGIEYVILRKDFVSNYPDYVPLGELTSFREKWHTLLEPILDAQKDMKIISDTAQYKIYMNLNNATKVFAPITSGGGLTDFDSLLSISNLAPLSNVALYPSVSESDSLIFLDNIAETNMSMSVNDFVDIGKYAHAFDAQKGWTDTVNSFGYDHILASRVNKGAFTVSPNSEISFELPAKYNSKDVEIWMKALAWNQGGPITIKINGQEHSPSLFSPDRSFRLFKIFEGESGAPYNITIQNIKGKNYVEGLYVREKGLQHLSASTSNKIILNSSTLNQKEPNLIANSNFSIVDNKSGLPLDWNDSLNNCGQTFTCKISVTYGWDDKLSYHFSTKRPHNNSGSWSSIYGQEISVDPSKSYNVLTHMKMNKYANQSHVLLEGFNEHSNKWYQISQCPAGISGVVQWQQFSCEIKIPENTTKIRPVLNAGWSSQPKVARTWFDDLSLTKLKDENFPNLAQIKKLILPEIGGDNKSSSTITTKIKEFNKVNPTLWNVHISTSKPATIGFAEPYHQSWEATVYQDGKKIDVVKSMPLYGAINAFQIKQTGNLDIVLSFAPQYWYQVGLVISGITFVFCIFYIIYDWRRNKDTKSSSSSSASVSSQV